MERFRAQDREYQNKTSGPKYLRRGPQIEWGELLLLPGEGSRDYGRHFHQVVEETFYFLEGSGKMCVNDVEFQVSAGEVVRIEPGEKHWLQNNTSAPLKAVFIKYPYIPEDRLSF